MTERYFLPRGFFLSGACVSAEPATLRTADVDFLSRKSLDALLATVFDVFSFFAMVALPGLGDVGVANVAQGGAAAPFAAAPRRDSVATSLLVGAAVAASFLLGPVRFMHTERNRCAGAGQIYFPEPVSAGLCAARLGCALSFLLLASCTLAPAAGV